MGLIQCLQKLHVPWFCLAHRCCVGLYFHNYRCLLPMNTSFHMVSKTWRSNVKPSFRSRCSSSFTSGSHDRHRSQRATESALPSLKCTIQPSGQTEQSTQSMYAPHRQCLSLHPVLTIWLAGAARTSHSKGLQGASAQPFAVLQLDACSRR